MLNQANQRCAIGCLKGANARKKCCFTGGKASKMAQNAFFGKCEMGEMKQITQIQRRLKILMTIKIFEIIKIFEKINFFKTMAHAHEIWCMRMEYGACA